MTQKKTIKLVVIGGGSVNWMRQLMRDVYLLENVEGGEIRLVDPNLAHAEAVGRMLKRFNELREKSFEITVTEDRRAALAGADFVLSTFSPGAMEAFYNDLEIPIRYGIRQPVSMTVGPCGLSASLRTCPVAFDLVKEMEEVCPGAVLLNVTNPMTAVTRAMNMAAKTVKVIGMCHEFHAFEDSVGRALQLPRPEGVGILEYLYQYLPEQGLDYTVAGINHFIWITRATKDGRDLLPDIREFARERLRHPGQPGREDIQTARKNFAKFALCDIFGCMPIVGDRHLIEFLPNLCNTRTGWGMELGVKKTDIATRLRGKERSLRDIEAVAVGEKDVDWQTSNEEMTLIMDAMVKGEETTGIMNLPNRGQIENLPADAIVETLADVHKDGSVEARPAGSLPRAIAALCQNQLAIQDLTLHAALHGDREAFVQALAMDPLSADANLLEIGDLADELLYSNRHWLDRFYDDANPNKMREGSDHVFFF